MPGDGPRHRAGADDRRRPRSVWPSTVDRAVGGQPAVPVDHGHLAPLEQPGQAAVQLVDDAGLALVGRRPVRLGRAAAGQLDPVLGGVRRRCGTPRPPAAAPWPGCSRGAGRCRRPCPSRPWRPISPADARVQRGRVAARAAAERRPVEVGASRASPPSGASRRSRPVAGSPRPPAAGWSGSGCSSPPIRTTGWSRCQKRLLLDGRGDLRAVAQPRGRLVQHHRAGGLLHRVDDRLDVQRDQRAHVDDLDRDAVLVQLRRRSPGPGARRPSR